MAFDRFRHVIVDGSWVPWWLTGPNRGRVMWSIGLALDTAVTWCQLGVQERFPLYCSEEALFWLGRDRGIPRGFAESTESYRLRLTRWLQTKARMGHAYGILEQVQTYFSPRAPLVRLVTGDTNIAQWWTRDKNGVESFHQANPSNWDWDSVEPGQTAITGQRRYWIIIYQNEGDDMFYFVPADDEAEQAPPRTRGTVGTTVQARDIAFLSTIFKQAGTWLAGVIIAGDSSSFAPSGSGSGYPDGRWYRYSDPATYLPVRLTSARYFHDRRRPGLFAEGLESELP